MPTSPHRRQMINIGGNERGQVKVDWDALCDVKTLPISRQPLNGKLKLNRGGSQPRPGLGSLAEHLYGFLYRNARHIAEDPLDLRRKSFAPSQARAKRIRGVK